MHTLVSQVHAVLQDADPYVELQIDDEMRLDQVELRAFGDDKAAGRSRSKHRKAFMKRLDTFPYPVKGVIYGVGGSKPDMVWIWRVPHGQVNQTKEFKVIDRIVKELPLYESRAKAAKDRVMLRGLGFQTGGAVDYVRRKMMCDCTAATHANRGDDDLHDRVCQYVASGFDHKLIGDLRHLNSTSCGFTQFFQHANDVSEKMETVTHERRHSADANIDGNMVEFASTMQSIPQLIEAVKQEYKDQNPDKELSQLPIPSAEWVRLAFASSNPFDMVTGRLGAHNHVGKIHMCRAIQKRTAHKRNMDEQFTHAVRRNIKSFSIECVERIEQINIALGFARMRDMERGLDMDLNADLIPDQIVKSCSGDDKAKVPIGSKGHAVSSKVKHRGNTYAPVDTSSDQASAIGLMENAADHDFTTGAATPAVILDCKLPKTLKDSMVDGEVTVNVYDSVFCASTGWRHAVQLVNYLIKKAQVYANLPAPFDIKTLGELTISKFEELREPTKEKIRAKCPSVLILSTDGGGDHKNTHITNQASMLAIQTYLKISKVILFRNCDNGSWANPVERINSILNLALYHKKFEREELATLEAQALNMSSMESLREAAKSTPQIKQEWEAAMNLPCEKMAAGFRRLSLKGNPMTATVLTSDVLDAEVNVLQGSLKEKAADYNPAFTTKAELSKMQEFAKFRDDCSDRSTYAFQTYLEWDRTPKQLRDFIKLPVPMPRRSLSNLQSIIC